MKYIAATYILSLTMLICCANKPGESKRIEVSATSEAVKNDLPSFEITFPNGKKTSVKNLTGRVALVLFQPDCDHCQREAEQIRNNLAGFKDFKIFFISSADMTEIVKFSEQYGLAKISNVVFARTESQNIISAFGPIEAPSIYLYRADGSLIESFNGEVAIEVVLKYI